VRGTHGVRPKTGTVTEGATWTRPFAQRGYETPRNVTGRAHRASAGPAL